jgi:mycothiol synthase
MIELHGKKGGDAVVSRIEVVDGARDSETMARISSDVMRWTTSLPERIDQLRAAIPSYRNWLAILEGEPVGTATCFEPPDMKESEAAFAEICVLPAARRFGVGTALLAHTSAHARLLGKSELEVGAFEDDPEGIQFGENRGYSCIMRLRSLRLVVAECPPPTVALPEGLTITTLAEQPDLARDVWEVAAEAIPDIPIDSDVPMHPGTFEEFRSLSLAGPRYISEATFVAMQDRKVVGYGQLTWLDPPRRIAHHAMLAVRRAFRGKGVAGALKAAQIAWARENSVVELRTENEERNAPVRAINAKYPYEPIPDWLLLRGPIATV